MVTMSFHFSYRFSTSTGKRGSLMTRFRCSYISHMTNMYYTIYDMSRRVEWISPQPNVSVHGRELASVLCDAWLAILPPAAPGPSPAEGPSLARARSLVHRNRRPSSWTDPSPLRRTITDDDYGSRWPSGGPFSPHSPTLRSPAAIRQGRKAADGSAVGWCSWFGSLVVSLAVRVPEGPMCPSTLPEEPNQPFSALPRPQNEPAEVTDWPQHRGND